MPRVLLHRLILTLVIVLASSISSVSGSLAGQRLALVIGINNYDKLPKLPVAKLDAEAVAATLADDLRFTVKHLVNPTRGEIINGWADMLAKIASSEDVLVLYYAGHGIELKGGNYLVPREVPFNPDPTPVITGSVAFQDLLSMLAERQRAFDATAIFILDACRENPFEAETKVTEMGLGPLKSLPRNVFVLYSAGIAQTALDGRPPNSVFTTQLLPLLKAEANDETALSDMAQRLRHKVYLDALQYTTFNRLLNKRGPHFQTPAYYDQFRTRLSILGNRVDQIKLEPVGSTLIDESQTRALGRGDILRECERCPELTVVGPGSFEMGSSPGAPGHDVSETRSGKPFTVSLTRPFAIGRFEISNGEWNACVKDSEKNKVQGGCSGLRTSAGQPGFERQPVAGVTWHDAQAYVTWLNVATKQPKPRYRLPTEAEWEFAARAGTGTAYSFGDDEAGLCTHAHGADANIGSLVWVNLACTEPGSAGRSTAQTGSFKPNPWGLFDMHGNVAEWVADCWQDTYDGAATDGSAVKSEDCRRRVIRGGSWRSGPSALRSAARNNAPPGVARATLGFRVARDLD